MYKYPDNPMSVLERALTSPSPLCLCVGVYLLCWVSGAISSFEETLNTLKYANRAKNIKVPHTTPHHITSHHRGNLDDIWRT